MPVARVAGLAAGLALAALALGAALGGAPATRGLRAEPLGAAPFFHAAEAQPAHALPLLIEARRRWPHDGAIRLALMRAQLGAGDMAGAISELAALARINPPQATALAQHVGEGAVTPALAEQAAQAFAPYPQLIVPFLDGLSRQPGAPQAAVAMNRLPPAALAAPEVRAAAVAALLAGGNYARARQTWLAGRADPGPVVAPDFARIGHGGAFGWRAEASSAGGVDQGDGGLTVTAYGRGAGTLLAQTLVLAPGRYRLNLRHAPAGGVDGLIHLRLACLPGGSALAEVPLAAGSGVIDTQLTLTVPAGCPGQVLALATPGGDGQSSTQRLIGLTLSRL